MYLHEKKGIEVMLDVPHFPYSLWTSQWFLVINRRKGLTVLSYFIILNTAGLLDYLLGGGLIQLNQSLEGFSCFNPIGAFSVQLSFEIFNEILDSMLFYNISSLLRRNFVICYNTYLITLFNIYVELNNLRFNKIR